MPISKITDKLFYFFDIAENILKELGAEVDRFTLNTICLYWQTHKRLLKTKDNKIKKKVKERENELLKGLQSSIGKDLTQTIKECIKKLNCIVQSSSAVECINSILRPYLNTSKNQTSQEFLNLFMSTIITDVLKPENEKDILQWNYLQEKNKSVIGSIY